MKPKRKQPMRIPVTPLWPLRAALLLAAVALPLTVAAAPPKPAQTRTATSQTAAARTTAADTRVIAGCLERADNSSETDTRARACIGIVAKSCVLAVAAGRTEARPPVNMDDAHRQVMEQAQAETGKKACIARELAVWQAQLNAGLAQVRGGGSAQMIETVRRSQETWAASTRALCPVFDEVDPGMVPGGAVYCTMTETANRALLLRALGEAVNEH
jgi:hypothetical protein